LLRDKREIKGLEQWRGVLPPSSGMAGDADNHHAIQGAPTMVSCDLIMNRTVAAVTICFQLICQGLVI
jgi:hypothetical protein